MAICLFIASSIQTQEHAPCREVGQEALDMARGAAQPPTDFPTCTFSPTTSLLMMTLV